MTASLTSRRSLIGALAASPLLLSTACHAAPAPSARSRICVQGRPQDSGSSYKFPNIMRALNQLGGVRLMRCREPFSKTVGWNTYVALARAGVRFCFTLTVRDPQSSVADLRAFLELAPGSIWGIEYPNEPDLNPAKFNGMKDVRLGFRAGNAPALLAYIRAMHAALTADPVLRSVPTIASNDYMQAEQGPFSTLGNSHIYPRANSDVRRLLADFRSTLARGHHGQGVITEWGRTTGGGPRNATAAPVTIEQQGELLASDLRTILAEPSVALINLYELLSWPGPSEQNNFGLFNADLSPRPIVAAIRNLMQRA